MWNFKNVSRTEPCTGISALQSMGVLYCLFFNDFRELFDQSSITFSIMRLTFPIVWICNQI